MKKPKAPRVPVLESAFEVNLPKLLRAVKASGRPEVVLVDGDEHTVAVVSDTRLAIHLGGRVWIADILAVPCLNGRIRPLLKCPRAHEGNFQALYYRAGELACRHCHALRYRSALAAGPVARARIAQLKLLKYMGQQSGDFFPKRRAGAWRKRYRYLVAHLGSLSHIHYDAVRNLITGSRRQKYDLDAK